LPGNSLRLALFLKQQAQNRRRLTINLREDLHKKLRLAAVEQDCNATDIIERLLVKELER
jgi:hypothetical protein